ncbi:catechol 2,3-dioxygenase-like lactoylglutathione lyase family enzyme [Pseudomonas sp. BIGb0450]|uniref:VOC family protein n=1 Tax=Pseudomonas yamanorum TaxID=515393 RepID=A0A7Y8K672_9PSED|nr:MULTISPECIES: VOC family protein [Pseudomonas]MCS3416955.1 catechol 2,3-dioxygenase-like lactoylglutathione lyase family enzyme [Pseudomonas sp. BIGb0558]MCS3436700.1 catechol 2,3-dioxygenase-like lactoylglutathione lyase family enzyme [Pseudomonas sp. BIGb0450]NWE11383.1 VOC family protein [Pseudomonas yamanorum]NWE77516.1 VOC family protein [Pseudomonas yamanorum]
MFIRNPIVPELIVMGLTASLDFWVTQLGFEIAYQRSEEGFAYLDLHGAQIMLEQYDPGAGQWLTAPLEKPLGRGINLQIDVPAVAPVLQRLAAIGWPLFRDVEDAWYRAGEVEAGQRQFIVQDPDGYLVRLVQRLGERPVGSHS